MDLHDKFLLWRSPTETQEDIPHLRCTGCCLCFFLLEVRTVLFLTLSCYVLIEFRIGICHYSSPFVRRSFCFGFNKATRGLECFSSPFHVSCCFVLMEESFPFPSKVKTSILFLHVWHTLSNFDVQIHRKINGTGRLLGTDSILKCCCRDCTSLIWT